MDISHCKIETVTPNKVNKGDTLLIEEKLVTVGKNSIKTCPFMGVTIEGKKEKSFTRVLFPKWYQGEIIRFQAQL